MDYASLFADVVAAKTLTREHTNSLVAPGLAGEQLDALNGDFNKSATVTAGAGAGKTRLLVERTAALIQAGVDPKKLAVVSFTRRAATEIADRLLTKLGSRSKLPVCGTVHSLALAGLRRLGESVRLATEEEQLPLLEALREELPEEFDDLSDSELLLLVNRCREEEDFSSTAGFVALRFEELLAAESLVDFTALMRLAAAREIRRFSHLLVDEAQDLSRLQMSFLAASGLENARYWYVGDADQSIYAFRGAHQGVMQQLRDQVEENFILSVNYRSAQRIVACANNVIANNEGRIPVKWRAHRSDAGRVAVQGYENAEAELAAARSWLKQRTSSRVVLARTQALIAPLRDEGLLAYTVHESKGLEWPEVWVMGCEAALFPHPLSARPEERRLFYVAMTRARDGLVLSHAKSRASGTKKPAAERQPSPFLFELQGLQG